MEPQHWSFIRACLPKTNKQKPSDSEVDFWKCDHKLLLHSNLLITCGILLILIHVALPFDTSVTHSSVHRHTGNTPLISWCEQETTSSFINLTWTLRKLQRCRILCCESGWMDGRSCTTPGSGHCWHWLPSTLAYSIRLACPKATSGNFLRHLFKHRRYFISKRREH